MIPYGKQSINSDDIDAVIQVLKSDFLTQGPQVPKFEKEIAHYCGAQFAIAVNSATSALHIACMALDIGPGDCVWTSPISFVASSNCALYCGATVDFVDIDPNTYNLSVECLEQKLIEAERLGKLPKVVIPVHLCGQSCNMEAIHKLGCRYGFRIIEDASHAIGAEYKDRKVGCCEYSDITIFSFHPVKIITTGEGGIALTNNEAIARRLRLHRSHGITSNAADMESRPDQEIWNYQQITLGFNYRMTDLQAALGLSQLTRLDEFVRRRNNIASNYNAIFTDFPLKTPWLPKECYSSYHLYVIRLNLEEIKVSKKYVYEALLKKGVGVNLHYIPIYRQPYYERLGFSSGYCPEAERYYAEALSIPIFSALTDADQFFVASSFQSVLNL